VTNLTTAREAKEFLIAQILAEADRQGAPLDDVERRMLYFTETAWMPDDTWEASEKFDLDYNQDAYEKKIANLIRDARQRDAANEQQWAEAISALALEDHYLSVMICARTRPPYDFLKLVLTALLIVALLITGIIVYVHFTGS